MISKDAAPTDLAAMRNLVQQWLTDRKVKGFYSVTQNTSLKGGAKSCMTLAGLGKLAPNMLMMGFKTDWRENMDDTKQYFNILK